MGLEASCVLHECTAKHKEWRWSMPFRGWLQRHSLYMCALCKHSLHPVLARAYTMNGIAKDVCAESVNTAKRSVEKPI